MSAWAERSRRPAAGALAAACLALAALAAGAAAPERAAVASAHPAASAAGIAMLEAGGNAFDAAVAVTAALAVVEPYSSGLGGGGFWLLHRARDGRQIMVDGRERAPGAATRDMYLDEDGEVLPRASMDGPLAAGIPGTVAALEHIARDYGRLPLARSLQPAIRLAREGFEVTPRYRLLAGFRTGPMRAAGDAAAIFLEAGEVPALGSVIRQGDLAAVLERLAAEGAAGFYRGPVAEKLVRGVREAGGIWTLEDLADYRIAEREPIEGRFRELRVVTASPPSSGGIVLVEALNILEPYALEDLPPAKRRHLVVEAMRRAYRDRADYLGDPDYVDMPIERLLDKDYAARLRRGIDPERATPSSELPPVTVAEGQGADTTHFSVVDDEGNLVAATLSINFPFGSGYVPPGTGVVLNNEMDDFSSRMLTPNSYGLVGDDANAIAPGKRPLSSMTPTFLFGPTGTAVLGTPGGSRIISMVLLGTLEFAAGGGPEAWVSRTRYHHQYLPDRLQFEKEGFDAREQAALEALGHRLEELGRRYGNMQAILWRRASGAVEAASDPRGEGAPAYRQR